MKKSRAKTTKRAVKAAGERRRGRRAKRLRERTKSEEKKSKKGREPSTLFLQRIADDAFSESTCGHTRLYSGTAGSRVLRSGLMLAVPGRIISILQHVTRWDT